MIKLFKKAALAALAGTLVVSGLAGCSSNVDGTKTVATVNDEAIQLGVVNFMTRYQQAQTAQMYEMYFGGASGIWDTVADEDSGETYGEQTVNNVMEQIEDMVLLRQHAEEYDVTISEEEKQKITEAAKSFMEANDEATLTTLGVSQEMVEEVLELSTYNEKMYDPMTADVDIEVSDDEAAQTGITYVAVSPAEETDTEEEDEAEDASAADPQEQAQQILDQVLATADADMDTIAKGVDENLSAIVTHFTTNPAETDEDEEEDTTSASGTVPQVLQDAAKKLSDGEVSSELIEDEGTYYVLRLDAAFDKDATEDQKTTIGNQRKQDFYDKTTEQWKEDSTINVEKKVLETIKLRDNDKYTFKAVEQESTEEESSEGLEGADAETNNVEDTVDAVDDALDGSDDGAEAESAEETPAE